MSKLAILGAGSWGTALALTLHSRFDAVALWVHDAAQAERLAAERENRKYLPGFPLPASVSPTADLAGAVGGADIVLGVMPSAHARGIYAQVRTGCPVVSATKGLERGTLLRMSQVIAESTGSSQIAVLSGPTFAREIAAGEPAAVVIASEDAALAARLQQAFSTPLFRPYSNTDPVGVELAAALKNVIAIAAGVVQGLGLGSNTRAALIARGLAELSRLARAAGARPETLAGLAGLGDLVLTCTGDLSRNRRVGIELAKGKSLTEILAEMQMVAEGVETTGSALALASKLSVEMPICTQVGRILGGETSPREAVRELMERSLKGE